MDEKIVKKDPKLKLVIPDELRSMPARFKFEFIFPAKQNGNGHRKKNLFKLRLRQIRRELR